MFTESIMVESKMTVISKLRQLRLSLVWVINLGQCFKVCGDQCSCDVFRESKRVEFMVEFKMVVMIAWRE